MLPNLYQAGFLNVLFHQIQYALNHKVDHCDECLPAVGIGNLTEAIFVSGERYCHALTVGRFAMLRY